MFSSQIYCVTFVNHRCTGGFTYFALHFIHATFCIEPRKTIKAKAMEEKYADNKAAGEKFLAENKAKEGVKTTESGLQYKVITEGKGEIPADTCKVKVNYKFT